jgi:hypothetical protein
MYRRPGSRPDYSDRPARRLIDDVFPPVRARRRRSWQLRMPTLVEIMIGLVLAIFVGTIAYEVYNPCIAHGPEKTYWQTVSCGENCFMVVPQTYRECLKRTR